MAITIAGRGSSPQDERKRKREDQDVSSAKTSDPVTSEKAESSKRKKRKRAKKDNDESDKYAEKKEGMDESIGKMDGRLLADYLAQRAKRHNKELTAVELDDIYVPEYAFLDTSSWQSTRTLENLPSFLKSYTPKRGVSLFQAPEALGSPHTIVVTLSGLRAADVTRSLREFQNQESAVAKLFAKHIKFKEAQAYVTSTRFGIGIGTPVRLNDLVNSGTLNLDSLKRIVIDGSYIDQKKRGIFDMKELHFPLLQLLNRADLRYRYESKEDDKVQLLVF